MDLKLVISLLFVLINIINGSENSVMECYEDNYYVNDWDGSHDNIKTNYLLNGQYSVHSNYYEDRRYKWRYCKPSLMLSFTESSILSITSYDEEWSRNCDDLNGGHSAIKGMISTHSNYYEDRQFTIHCGGLDLTKFRLNDCFWTKQLNNYDGELNYDCPNNGVIRG